MTDTAKGHCARDMVKPIALQQHSSRTHTPNPLQHRRIGPPQKYLGTGAQAAKTCSDAFLSPMKIFAKTLTGQLGAKPITPKEINQDDQHGEAPSRLRQVPA
jgi:hypothetical protein